jgi:hypothetical protein
MTFQSTNELFAFLKCCLRTEEQHERRSPSQASNRKTKGLRK